MRMADLQKERRLSDPEDPATHRPLRSFGRIRGRALKPRQADLITTLLPRLAIPLGPLNPRQLAPAARETWLEIGFGAGEHLAGQAARNPDVLLLGAEPFVNGLGSALRHIAEADLTNVRLHAGDARELMAALPDASISRVFILFPDPWPKARHQKRRLVQPAFAQDIARVLKPGGTLRIATDWADYADQCLRVISATPGLTWTAECADDWRNPPADHISTRYELKRLGDCAHIFLEFARL
jgi:tRNA (guanine-N7-)-methyltransferase